MAKSTTDTCCLTLPLKLEKWQEDRLEKRFEIARQIYNAFVRAELKKLHRLEHTPEYQKVQSDIQGLYQRRDEIREELKEKAEQ